MWMLLLLPAREYLRSRIWFKLGFLFNKIGASLPDEAHVPYRHTLKDLLAQTGGKHEIRASGAHGAENLSRRTRLHELW
jgi:hypothetical protein